MLRKLMIVILAGVFSYGIFPSNIVAVTSEKLTPRKISLDQIVPSSPVPLTGDKGFCLIQSDNDSLAYFFADFQPGDGFALYMDPMQCGVPDPYPFRITDVHFYLYHYEYGYPIPDTSVWPVEIQVNIKDLAGGDKCNGPGSLLCSQIYTIPSDSAYPNLIHLDLHTLCCVYAAFFLEIIYTGQTDPPYPSLLMTDENTNPADTCDAWAWYFWETQHLYFEWSEFWAPFAPGYPVMRITGYTAEPCTTAIFTHLDTLWVPWGKMSRFTNDKPVLGFRIDCVETPDFLESVTLTSFITKAFSLDTVRLYVEANGTQGLQVGPSGDTKIAEHQLMWYEFDTNDTLRIWGLHYALEPGSNKFYAALCSYSDSIGANPLKYQDQPLEAIIRPGRIVLNSGKTNPDSIYNRPYGGIDDDSTGFCPNWQGSGFPNCRYRLVFDTFLARGDANGDGDINVADVIYLANYLFIYGPAPDPLEAGDANCDGAVNVADITYLVNYLFLYGPPPGC